MSPAGHMSLVDDEGGRFSGPFCFEDILKGRERRTFFQSFDLDMKKMLSDPFGGGSV